MPLDLDKNTLLKIFKTVDDLREEYGHKPLERVAEAIRINTSRDILPKVLNDQSPGVFYFPDLNDKPWYEPTEFDELNKVFSLFEDNYKCIKEEYLATIKEKDLISYEEQIPTVREERKKSGEEDVLLPRENWGTFSLMLGGREIPHACTRLPYANKLLTTLKNDHLAAGGAFFFSTLAPKTHIPPHHDSTNIRLTFHLGIKIPENCGIRVGRKKSGWDEGKCLIFNSTFKHEAWNWSDKQRVCLIVDIWNPNLTPIERIALDRIYNEHLASRSV